MTPLDGLLIGAWVVAIVASLAIIWTPWRLTRGDLAIDLSDQLTGRPISPLHAFAVPAVLLIAPIVVAVAGGGDVRGRPHLLAPLGLLFLAIMVGVQLLLRREIHDRSRAVIWLNPEPESYWGQGDSVMNRYARFCHVAKQCATLEQLERIIEDVLRSYVPH